MRKEDMVRMIESGEQLPDYCQEEIDNINFKNMKEHKDGKISIRRTRRVITNVGKSHRMGLSRLDGGPKATRSNSRLQQKRKQIHNSRIRKK